jgi:hypothetical protein
VTYPKRGRIVEVREPIDDLEVYAADLAMYRRDRSLRAVERVLDGQVIEHYEVA